jgi:hypothetical protein
VALYTYSVPGVLGQTSRFSFLLLHLGHLLSSRDVEVLHLSEFRDRSQKVVVRQVAEEFGLRVVFHAVELDSVVIIHIEKLFLSYCEHLLILKETGVSDHLFG